MEVKQKKPLSEILEKKKQNKDDMLSQLFNLCWSSKNKCEANRDMYIEYFNTANLYYYGMLPKNTLSGDAFNAQVSRKEHVDQVLFRIVNADLPNLLDAFTSDRSLAVAIRSRGWRVNPELEKQITVEINKHFRDTDGYAIIRNSIKTMLIAGNTDIKIFLDKYVEHDQIDYGDDEVELTEFLASLDEGWTLDIPKKFDKSTGSYKGFKWHEIKQQKQNPQTGEVIEIPVLILSGKIPIVHPVKKLVIEEIEPQDIWYDTSYGSDFSKLRYACNRIRTTVGDAELRGFDPEKIKDATDEKQDYSTLPDMYFTQVNYQDPNFGSDSLFNREPSTDDKERPISLYEHWIKSSIPSKNNEVKLYKVITNNFEVLEYSEVKRFPFVHGVMEQVQGQFYGRGWYDVCKPFQDAGSLGIRLHQHNAMLTTWPQYLAVKGQYDRQSLLNNKPGAVIEQMAAGSIERFEHKEISQSFITAMAALKESENETLAQPIGVSNSDGGIPQVATATAYLSIYQDSQKGAIRKNTIEQTFINPMFSLMYEICKDEGMIKDPDGNVISPNKLPNKYECIIDTDTKYDDFGQQLQLSNFVGMATALSQINSPYMNEQNKYSVLAEFLDKADIDVNRFLTDPSQNQDPHAAVEQAEQQALFSEIQKIQKEGLVLDNWNKAAKFVTEQATAEKLHADATNGIAKDQVNSAAKIQKVMNDAKQHADEMDIKQQEVDVKNKQVNYDTVLQGHKQAYEINANRVNGQLR